MLRIRRAYNLLRLATHYTYEKTLYTLDKRSKTNGEETNAKNLQSHRTN